MIQKSENLSVHVCFVVPAAYTIFNKKASKQAGGSEMQAYLYSTGLAQDPKLKVSCLVADYSQNQEEIIENVLLVKSFSYSKNKIFGFVQLYKTLRTINPDVCLFRSPSIGVFIGIFIAKKLLHKKVIYMIAHDIESAFKTRSKIGFFTAFLMFFGYKMADAIVAQTYNQKNAFESNLKIPVPTVIRNIVQFVESPKQKERSNILWVGRCDAIKQPEIFLQLAEKYNGLQFTMICPISRDEILWKRISEKAGQIPNLKFMGYVNPTEILQYYSQSKLYVSTAFLEGFSNSMTEALSCGCPVLTLNHNPDNILEDFNVGKSANGKLSQFFSLFHEMISNENTLKQMSANGPLCVKTFHNKEESLRQIKNLIFEQLNNKT